MLFSVMKEKHPVKAELPFGLSQHKGGRRGGWGRGVKVAGRTR